MLTLMLTLTSNILKTYVKFLSSKCLLSVNEDFVIILLYSVLLENNLTDIVQLM